MAIKLDDNIFNAASQQATQAALAKTAEERIKAMGTSAYITIITELKKQSVTPAAIAKLEAEINTASDKNQVLLNVLKRGGEIASAIMKIIK